MSSSKQKEWVRNTFQMRDGAALTPRQLVSFHYCRQYLTLPTYPLKSELALGLPPLQRLHAKILIRVKSCHYFSIFSKDFLSGGRSILK